MEPLKRLIGGLVVVLVVLAAILAVLVARHPAVAMPTLAASPMDGGPSGASTGTRDGLVINPSGGSSTRTPDCTLDRTSDCNWFPPTPTRTPDPTPTRTPDPTPTRTPDPTPTRTPDPTPTRTPDPTPTRTPDPTPTRTPDPDPDQDAGPHPDQDAGPHRAGQPADHRAGQPARRETLDRQRGANRAGRRHGWGPLFGCATGAVGVHVTCPKGPPPCPVGERAFAGSSRIVA